MVPANSTTINIGNLTIDNYVGTLDFSANNNNITMNAFSNQGSAVRTLNMGNGTWTITGTGNNWSMVTTNLTFNSNSSTLLFNNNTGATSRTVNCGSANLTYNAVTVQGASPLQFNCALTIGTLTLVGITDVYLSSTGYVVNHFATTTTGSSSATLRALSATSSPPSISTPNASIVNWMAFFNITVTGAGSLTAKNSFDMGKNTGISFTAAAGGATACILGGWLLWRDLTPEEHDNFPAYLDKAA